MQLRVLNTLQRDHRNPLTLAHILKLKLASENLSDCLWWQIAMISKVTCFEVLPCLPASEKRMDRLILRRKYQCNIVRTAKVGSGHHLIDRKVFDPHRLQRALYVAQLGASDFIRRGPRREDA